MWVEKFVIFLIQFLSIVDNYASQMSVSWSVSISSIKDKGSLSFKNWRALRNKISSCSNTSCSSPFFLCLVYILVETAQDETRTSVWRVYSSRLSHSQPVLVSSRNSRKHDGKSVLSQRKWECLECLASLSKVLWLHSRSVPEYKLWFLNGGNFFFLSTVLWLLRVVAVS